MSEGKGRIYYMVERRRSGGGGRGAAVRLVGSKDFKLLGDCEFIIFSLAFFVPLGKSMAND